MLFKQLIVAAVAAATSTSALAAIATYSDGPTWLSAAGAATGSENFNQFVSDILVLPGSPVALSDGMSVEIGAGSSDIDVPPLNNVLECSLDGSAHFCAYTSVPVFSFVSPISAFGADFSSINDLRQRTEVDLYLGAALVGTVVPPVVNGQLDQFFGIFGSSGETFDRITLRPLVGVADTFGIDNIQFVAAASIPEPGTLALLGLGLAGLAASRRRKQ